MILAKMLHRRCSGDDVGTVMKNRKLSLACLTLIAVGILGCAAVNDKAQRLFSSRANAIAVVNGQLMNGVVDVLPDRTGTVSLTADGEPSVRCAGPLRYTGSTSGSIELQCSNGSRADLQINAMTDTRGYAYGHSGKSESSLTYGFQDSDAIAMLRPPLGKKLVLRAGGEGLEIQ